MKRSKGACYKSCYKPAVPLSCKLYVLQVLGYAGRPGGRDDFAQTRPDVAVPASDN
jgi:hypothetical protein